MFSGPHINGARQEEVTIYRIKAITAIKSKSLITPGVHQFPCCGLRINGPTYSRNHEEAIDAGALHQGNVSNFHATAYNNGYGTCTDQFFQIIDAFSDDGSVSR